MEQDRLKRLLHQAARLEKWNDEPYRRTAGALFGSYHMMVEEHNAGRITRERLERALNELLRSLEKVLARLEKQRSRSRYPATQQAAGLWSDAFRGYQTAFRETLEYLRCPDHGMEQARQALEAANHTLCRANTAGLGPARQ